MTTNDREGKHMNVKPILFSTPMVAAILAGRKTMTRRVVKPQPVDVPEGAYMDPYNHNYEHFTMWTKDNKMCLGCGGNIKGTAHWKPRYQLGAVLWVRETWCENKAQFGDAVGFWYCAGCDFGNGGKCLRKGDIQPWNHEKRPSIFMPKAAARIFLRVTDVRVERVQDITPRDAWDEGCRIGTSFPFEEHIPELQQMFLDLQFKPLWDSLNAKRGYGWNTSPWVWVYTFEPCDKPEGWGTHDNQ
jgi:hypothetical protein